MRDTVKVRLMEDWDNFDEGFEFRVEESELWTLEDIYQRWGSKKGFVEVEFFDDTYFVSEDILEEISDRMA